ncbi:phenylacetate--CoA ligase family protein [bacterium]|nr:phenylacetate--CoA ligase family protein [bacterium]
MSLREIVGQSLWTLRQFGPSRASPAQLRMVQERRLRQLLCFAADRSPFYRDRLRGLDLDHCPLTAIPPTNKAELMADFDRVVTDATVRRADLERFVDDPANVGKRFLDRFPVCHTSGSQGQPLLLVHNQLTLDVLFACQMTRGNAGYRVGFVEAAKRLFSPARLAVVISRPGFFPSAWVWKHLPRGLRPYVRLLYVSAGDPDLMAKLAAFRPTVLTSTPTTLDLLALRPDRPRFDALRQVVTWSETLTAGVRERLLAAYGAPVRDTYGCGECLFLSNGCPTHPGAHVNADWAILEVVGADGRPVPAGEAGYKVYLTNLANPVQPLIRYELGDRLRMATARCACGSRLPRIETIDGRAAEVFRIDTATGPKVLTAYPFQHAFDHFRGVREWQATQLDGRRVRVRFELLPGATLDRDATRARLNDRLALAGFAGVPEVSFEVVPRLEADPATGKFQRMRPAAAPASSGRSAA